MIHNLKVISSTLLSTVNLWRGTNAHTAALRPQKPLELYEMEGCPFCRLVREVLTELDLDAHIFPCPKGGKRFRPKAVELGGKAQFPFLVDPNTGVNLYESKDIVKYLFETYGKREIPLKWKLMNVQKLTSVASGVIRPLKGLRSIPSKAPQKSLELYSFESSPYSRLVRELLCELELPYYVHNVGKQELADFVLPLHRKKLMPQRPIKGENRNTLFKKGGKLMVPYLIDPNTQTQMYESAEILKYLTKTYAIKK